MRRKNRAMEEKIFNEDYIKGMKFLLEKSREQKINIRKAQWIPNVSKMLSEHNLCYNFWYNVWRQNGLSKIPLCETWYDVLFKITLCLFEWAWTNQGYTFWKEMFHLILLPKIHSMGLSEWSDGALESLTLYR